MDSGVLCAEFSTTLSASSLGGLLNPVRLPDAAGEPETVFSCPGRRKIHARVVRSPDAFKNGPVTPSKERRKEV